VLTALLPLLGAIGSQVVGDAITAFGGDRLSRSEQKRLAAATTDALVRSDLPQIAASLTPKQAACLRSFIESVPFEHLVRQALATHLTQQKIDPTGVVREQVRHLIRLWAVADENLYEVTDLVMALIEAAVTVGTPHSGSMLMNTRAAADLIDAGARNGRLLGRIESLARVDEFAQQMREGVAAHTATIRVNHGGRALVARYDDFYVPSEVQGEDGSTRWLDVLDPDRPRAVVLGDPGAGKSTLAAKLVHDIAADTDQFVPFLLVVRDHATSLRAEHETIRHYLQAIARRPFQLEPEPDVLEYLLLNGRALVVIDGLDELGESSHRVSFAAMVDAFARRYPSVLVVVTSRLVGYDEAPLDRQLFPVAKLAPFTPDQVEEYVARFFTFDGRDNVDELTAGFMAESEASADIRSNPLMLSLLCTLYASTNYIPRNRAEVYERCAELLFERWDRSRGLDVTHRYAADVRPAVQRIAWRLMTDPAGRQTLSRRDMAAELTAYLGERRYEDQDEAAQAAEDFIVFCTGRAWVLTDVGSDRAEPQYGFAHRTFLEYFASGQLVRLHPDPAQVWKVLRQRIGEGAWQITAQLAVQMLDRNLDCGADRILDLAIADAQKSPPSFRYTTASFCIGCLDVVTPGVATMRRLIGFAADLASALPIRERMYFGSLRTSVSLPADTPIVQLFHRSGAIARQAVECISAFAEDPKRYPSAGLVGAALVDLTPAVGDAPTEKALPAAIVGWLQFKRDLGPRPDPLDGFDPYFAQLITPMGMAPPPLLALLGLRSEPPQADVLRSLYADALAQPVGQPSGDQIPLFAHAWTIDPNSFDDLDIVARSAALLLAARAQLLGITSLDRSVPSGQWNVTTMDLPLELFTGLDMTSEARAKINEWSRGTS
jgi:hypothetical protein